MEPVDCERCAELLSARLDGELSGQETQELEAHLGQCPECRALAGQLDQVELGFKGLEELEAPEGYEIDNPGPQYVVLPSGSDKTVTVTFTDTPEITGEGSIRKVDADNPTKGLAGAVIKITGVDNDFTGTYVTGAGGYLTDVPWKDMPLGSYTAEEVTPPEGYTKCCASPVLKYAYHASNVLRWKTSNRSIICFAHSKLPVELAVIRLQSATDGASTKKFCPL